MLLMSRVGRRAVRRFVIALGVVLLPPALAGFPQRIGAPPRPMEVCGWCFCCDDIRQDCESACLDAYLSCQIPCRQIEDEVEQSECFGRCSQQLYECQNECSIQWSMRTEPAC